MEVCLRRCTCFEARSDSQGRQRQRGAPPRPRTPRPPPPVTDGCSPVFANHTPETGLVMAGAKRRSMLPSTRFKTGAWAQWQPLFLMLRLHGHITDKTGMGKVEWHSGSPSRDPPLRKCLLTPRLNTPPARRRHSGVSSAPLLTSSSLLLSSLELSDTTVYEP